jgi:predicted phosphodiesterase
MKILVISDIHANITALDTVLQAAGEIDAAWCLGDIVGYGADLNECVERVRSLPNLLCVKGNHDRAISDSDSLAEFNYAASQAILLSRKMISEENIAFLQGLPEVLTTELATLAHGSPRNPIWEYILDSHTAQENLDFISTPLAFVGHSHLPLMFAYADGNQQISRRLPLPGSTIQVTGKAILNPGSVGQPRDNDPRTSFGIFDPDAMTWQIQRVDYDIPAVQARIRAAGLPEKHAQRLSEGW